MFNEKKVYYTSKMNTTATIPFIIVEFGCDVNVIKRPNTSHFFKSANSTYDLHKQVLDDVCDFLLSTTCPECEEDVVAILDSYIMEYGSWPWEATAFIDDEWTNVTPTPADIWSHISKKTNEENNEEDNEEDTEEDNEEDTEENNEENR